MKFLFLLPPLIASLSWLSMLIILLILWFLAGRPKSKSTSPDITYISGIGTFYDWIFITGSSITAVFFVITLIFFALQKNVTYMDSTTSLDFRVKRSWAHLFALVFGTTAMACLVSLTIINGVNDVAIHWILTLSFSSLVILCAVFNIVGVSSLRRIKRLSRFSYILKLIFVILGTLCLFIMIILIYSCFPVNDVLTPSCNIIRSTSAVFEWVLGLLLFVFISTWIIDFSGVSV